jgi:uncharacterized protein YkwD
MPRACSVPYLRMLLVCCALALVMAVPAAPADAGASRAALRKINHVRHRHGLRGLRWSRTLAHSAKGYSRFLMRHDFFGHLGSIHASHRFHRLGEVLEFHTGGRARPRLAVRLWMHSPGHRGILLGRGFRYIGLGRTTGTFGGRHTTIWVGHLGG